MATPAYLEMCVKPGRRMVVDMSMIKMIFTSEGFGFNDIAPPDHPLTIVFSNGMEYEVFAVSPRAIMVAMQTYGRSDGCLPLP